MTQPKPSLLYKSRHPLEIHHLSHDLRGPLNSVLGFTELLIEGIEGPLNDIQREDIAAIQQSARSLLQLIDAVVDLGKLDANQLHLNFEPVPIEALGQAIQIAIEPVNQNDGPSLVLELPETYPPIPGDINRLRQVVCSLIDFFTSKNGAGQITIVATAQYTGQNATLQITCPHIIIPAAQLNDLFALTVEIDQAGHSKLTEGGLHLPLAHKLIQKHGGQLDVASTPENGTTFTLNLPLHQPNQSGHS